MIVEARRGGYNSEIYGRTRDSIESCIFDDEYGSGSPLSGSKNQVCIKLVDEACFKWYGRNECTFVKGIFRTRLDTLLLNMASWSTFGPIGS